MSVATLLPLAPLLFFTTVMRPSYHPFCATLGTHWPVSSSLRLSGTSMTACSAA